MRPFIQIATYFPLMATMATATAIPAMFEKRQFAPTCDPRNGGVNQDDCNVAWLKIPTSTNVALWTTDQSLAVPPNFNGVNEDLNQAQTWSSRECTIALWMPDGRNWDYASWSDIDVAAASIISTCVGPSRQGGRITVAGFNNALQVVIYQDSEDTDALEDTDPNPSCRLNNAEQYQDVTDCFLGGIAFGSGGKKAKRV